MINLVSFVVMQVNLLLVFVTKYMGGEPSKNDPISNLSRNIGWGTGGWPNLIIFQNHSALWLNNSAFVSQVGQVMLLKLWERLGLISIYLVEYYYFCFVFFLMFSFFNFNYLYLYLNISFLHIYPSVQQNCKGACNCSFYFIFHRWRVQILLSWSCRYF